MSLERTHRYDDIIGLSHHRSRTRSPMPAAQRAAQFMPFAALSGYEAIIDDVARPRAWRVELGEDAREELNRRLAALLAHPEGTPRVEVTYFVPECEGADVGAYVTVRGAVSGYDGVAHRLRLDGRCDVPCAQVVRIVVDG